MFVNSPNFLLLLISHFIPLWSEDILFLMSVFKFIETCFVALHSIYPGKFRVLLRRMCILLLLCGGFFRCLLLDLVSYSVHVFRVFAVFCLVLFIIESAVSEISRYYCWMVYFSLSVFASCILGLLGTYLYVCNCRIFLMDWPFYLSSLFLLLVTIFLLSLFCLILVQTLLLSFGYCLHGIWGLSEKYPVT